MGLTDFTPPGPGTLAEAWATPVNDILNAIKAGLNALEIALGQVATDDATAIAAVLPHIAAMRQLRIAPQTTEVGLKIIGSATPGVRPLQLWLDSGLVEIGGVKNAGGLYMTDWISVYRSVSSPPRWRADIYGNVTVNGMVTYTWPGPPGNLLSHEDACQEVFDTSRAASLGGWNIPFGAGSIALQSEQPFGVPRTDLPTAYSSIRLTANASGSLVATTASGVFGYPATPAQAYSAVISTLPEDTVRSPRLGLQFFDGSGVLLSQLFGSTAAQSGLNQWTTLTSGALTAPASTAFMCPVLQFQTAANGEHHRISSAAVYKGTQTVFSPPAVANNWPTFGSTAAGDRWRRSDTPSVANQREYICTTGGAPAAQVWSGIL